MKLHLRVYGSTVDLIVKSGDVEIIEDLTYFNKEKGVWLVDEDSIRMFITLANDLIRLNGVSDIDFVKIIYESFLNDAERAEFLESIKTNKP